MKLTFDKSFLFFLLVSSCVSFAFAQTERGDMVIFRRIVRAKGSFFVNIAVVT